jgi:hypothetical protein
VAGLRKSMTLPGFVSPNAPCVEIPPHCDLVQVCIALSYDNCWSVLLGFPSEGTLDPGPPSRLVSSPLVSQGFLRLFKLALQPMPLAAQPPSLPITRFRHPKRRHAIRCEMPINAAGVATEIPVPHPHQVICCHLRAGFLGNNAQDTPAAQCPLSVQSCPNAEPAAMLCKRGISLLWRPINAPYL